VKFSAESTVWGIHAGKYGDVDDLIRHQVLAPHCSEQGGLMCP
jgi:hypothetical protein